LKILPLLILGLTILSVTWQPVLASKISIELQEGIAHVTIMLSMNQNFTVLQSHVIDLGGQDLNVAREALEKAIKARLNDAMLSDVAVRITTTETKLNLTVSFNVHNVSSVSGDIMKVNCAWRSFSVPNDLVSQNVSYNLVGKTYIEPIVLSYANSTWARFYLNETQSVFYQDAANAAGNATLLDFQALSKPLTSWNRTLDLENQKTTWFLPTAKIFDLTMTVQEPNQTKSYYSVIDISSDIIGPSFATINGDTVVWSQNTIDEPLMLATIIIVLAITLGIYVYGRRIRRKETRPRR
jgi:hypothetical protein